MKGSVTNTVCWSISDSILKAALLICLSPSCAAQSDSRQQTDAGYIAGNFAPVYPSPRELPPSNLKTKAPPGRSRRDDSSTAEDNQGKNKAAPGSEGVTAGRSLVFDKIIEAGNKALLDQDLVRARSIFQHACAGNSKNAGAIHGLARVLIAGGRADEAIKVLRRGIKSIPEDASLHALLGDVLISKADLISAAGELKLAVALNEKDAESHLNLAQIAVVDGDSASAVKHALESLRYKSFNPQARVILAQQFANGGLVDEAILQISKALQESPLSAQLKLQLGILQISKGAINSGIENLKAAHGLDPASCVPLEQLTYAFGQRGDWPNACDYAELWTKAEKDNPAALLALGWAQFRSNELYDASPTMKRVTQLDPESSTACNAYGLILLDLRKADDALTQFKQALKLAPADASASLNIGTLYICTGKLTEGVEWLRKTTQEHSRLAQAWGLKAYACARAGLDEEAGEAIAKTMSLDKSESMALIAQSYLDLKAGATDKAIKRLKGVVKLNPTSGFVLTELAAATLKQGDVKEALQLAQQALQLAPYNMTTKACMARALQAAENYDGAILLLKECTARNQKNVELRVQLAQAQEKKGELYEAIRSYEQALKLNAASTEALCGLSRIALTEKRLGDAVSFADRAVSSARHEDQPRMLLIKALMELKDWGQANHESNLLMQQSPNNGEAAQLTARVAFAAGRWREAADRFAIAGHSGKLTDDDVLAYAESLAQAKRFSEAQQLLSGVNSEKLSKRRRARLDRLVLRLKSKVAAN